MLVLTLKYMFIWVIQRGNNLFLNDTKQLWSYDYYSNIIKPKAEMTLHSWVQLYFPRVGTVSINQNLF